jgi:hypothetical protein
MPMFIIYDKQLRIEHIQCIQKHIRLLNDLFWIYAILQIKGNQNGYQASTTMVDIYNVRHMKIIQSTKSKDFCLRIEVCGVGENYIE